MKYLFIIPLLFLCSCGDVEGQETKRMNNQLQRYENDEVVCYIYTFGYAGGLSCKWKEVK